MKLSPKVILLVLGVLVISMSMLSVPLYWYTRVALEDALGDQLIRMSHMVSQNLDPEYLQALSTEPELLTLRGQVETGLQNFSTEGIEGITLYRRDGTILAQNRKRKSDFVQLAEVLPGLLALEGHGKAVVSEIYETPSGLFIKAVALPIKTGGQQDVILVIWAGADYMRVIGQLQGSLLWIFLASLLIASTLTWIFSRSLIRPVQSLSSYAKAIQTNLSSQPVDLQRKDEFGDLNLSLIDMHAEIQKQEESARQLLAGIAHEIKNPLGGMEIYSGLLRDELSNLPQETAAETGAYLEKINAEVHHLSQIVQEYLDYARPLKSIIEEISIRSVFTDIETILKPEMRSQEQELELHGDAYVQTDRSKLHRVFLNLIQNGLTASGPGKKVHVRVFENRETVALHFEDQGAGIPEQDRERIFEPYFSTTDRGYGLGLSIVQSILMEIGGTILVQKSDSKGSVFVATLPKKESKEL